eukprot:11990837-Ditylum_brightwellii.AAC.1
MAMEIKNGTWRAKIQEEHIVAEWKKDNQNKEDGKMGKNTVPKFILYVGTKKWEPIHDRVEAQ